MNHKENKMGVMPINNLLISMSLPIMLSMLVQALYNVVDSVFVSMISENALSAVSLAFPIQNLMIAVGTGTGVGINALLSKSLGEKKYDQANKAAKNGIFLALLSSLAFVIFGFFFSRKFFEIQTNDIEIINYATDYLSICTIFSIGIFGQICFERLLQATGRTLYSMFTQGLGAIINIILDPILIFGLLGFPKMGVAGAAAATVIGQIAGMIAGLIFNIKKNEEISLDFKKFVPSFNIIKKIYSVGIPSIIMASIGSIMVFGLNKIIMVYTSTATAVLGVYFKLQSFIFMPVFGLNNGVVSIIAFNYGAQKKDRIIKTIKLGILYAVSIMFIGFLTMQLVPDKLFSMFNPSDDMLKIGVPALRTISYSFILAGFCIISSTVFQALGHGILSLIMSVVRQLVVLLPVAYLLSKLGNLDAVWFAFPIAELFAAILCSIFLYYTYKKVIKPIGSDEPKYEAKKIVPVNQN